MIFNKIRIRPGVKKPVYWLSLIGMSAASFYLLIGDIYEELSEDAPNQIVSPVQNDGKTGEVVVKIQKTAGFFMESDGRRYVIWEGLVLEELNNNTGFDQFRTDFDMNNYDFDLELIIHTTNTNKGGGGIARTFFHDLSPGGLKKVARVKQIGCQIAKGYFNRAATAEYGDPPEDVVVFAKNHCPEVGAKDLDPTP